MWGIVCFVNFKTSVIYTQSTQLIIYPLRSTPPKNSPLGVGGQNGRYLISYKIYLVIVYYCNYSAYFCLMNNIPNNILTLKALLPKLLLRV